MDNQPGGTFGNAGRNAKNDKDENEGSFGSRKMR
jgi:hypothetical protein